MGGRYLSGSLYRPYGKGRIVCGPSLEAVQYRLKARLDSLVGARQVGDMTREESDAKVEATLATAKQLGYRCEFSSYGWSHKVGYWYEPNAVKAQ